MAWWDDSGCMKTADPTSLPQEFGARCRSLRAERDMSQMELAQLIGMDRSYYASIEMGMRNVSLHNAWKIARGFSVTLSQLLEGVGEEAVCESSSEF